MKVLNSKISIGSFVFTFVNDLEVTSSWKELTDTAKIILPANIKLDHNKLSDQIKVGDKVKIELGYDDNYDLIFKGYVTSLMPKIPVEIKCEDEMWKLKQGTIKDSGRNYTITKLLQKHFSQYQTDSFDVDLGTYYIDNISGAKVLKHLQSDFGAYSFFRKDVLTVGKQYNPETLNHVKFILDYNMIGEDLAFKKKEDVKIKVLAISNKSNGDKIEVELGDPEGETRSLNFYDLSEKELRAAAEREKDRLIYDGWRGKFTAFGEPIVYHGDIVELEHNEDSDKKGRYFVDSVVYKFGLGGFRQEIELGPKA